MKKEKEKGPKLTKIKKKEKKTQMLKRLPLDSHNYLIALLNTKALLLNSKKRMK